MHNWNTDIELLKIAVANNISIASTIRELGLSVGGANYKMVKSRIKQYNIETSHWLGQAHKRNKPGISPTTKRPLLEILVEDSTYLSTTTLKKRLLKEELLRYACSICLLNEWLGKPLSLQLEHINGINDDNRIENLTLLCPNCHSQTATFAGRNKNGARGGTRTHKIVKSGVFETPA